MKPVTNSLRQSSFAALCVICFAASLYAQNQQRSTKSKTQSANAVPLASDKQQENFPPELLQQLEAIKTAALGDDYAYQRLAHLTENIGARPSGSAGAKAAVEYVVTQMRDVGLDVHLEEVKVPHWLRGVETAALVNYSGHTPGTQQKIVLTTLGGSTSTGAGGITADLVVVNTFDQLRALERDKVAGKIVLFNQKFDKEKANAGLAFAAYRDAVGYREAGPTSAVELGAVAALVRSVGGADYRLPHTGDCDHAGIPAASVSAEDADLIAHLATEGTLSMHLTLNPQKLPDESSYNVIGDLKGSEHPEQVVIVSGHLDSWDLGTGAIDDGAGVVIAMETAQLLQQLRLHPKRTLRVIAWMDEETDGSGSKQYRKDYGDDFLNSVAAIESDAGAAHPLGFATKMSKGAAAALKPIQTVLSSIGATVFEESSRPPGTTDILPMSEEGVPIIGILQDARNYYNYHHTAADTLDKVIPSELRENAAAMAVMAYTLANMKNPLPR